MTRLNLPKPLEQYFVTTNSGNLEGLLACFTPDARVHDEGQWIHGRAALAEWAQKSRAKYNFTAYPQAVEQSSEVQPVVLAEVTGSFPGSPLDLRFHFTLDNGAIDALVIKP